MTTKARRKIDAADRGAGPALVNPGAAPEGRCSRPSMPGAGHKIYPYLPRALVIDRDFLCLAAIMDWHSRSVLTLRVSKTMDTGFCVSALETALARFGSPKIFNTVQGSKFTSTEFTVILTGAGIKISMDGKGRWMDKVFVARL